MDDKSSLKVAWSCLSNLFNFKGPNHISRTAKATVVKFCTETNTSSQRNRMKLVLERPPVFRPRLQCSGCKAQRLVHFVALWRHLRALSRYVYARQCSHRVTSGNTTVWRALTEMTSHSLAANKPLCLTSGEKITVAVAWKGAGRGRVY